MNPSFRRIATAVVLATAALTAVPLANAQANARAPAGEAAKTKYPIVLVHGFAGFDNILGLVNYFYQIPGALRAEGAKVYIAQVNPAQTTEYRGEELNRQLDAWKARDGVEKFNLIGHSHGGPTSRYAAGTRDDIASVTTVSGTHHGSKVADGFLANVTPGSAFDRGATTLLQLVGLISGARGFQNAHLMAALKALSTKDSARFNAMFPHGQNAEFENGQYFYSYAGAQVKTNALDVSDPLLAYTATFFGAEPNDGLVSPSEAKWGKPVDMALPWNHLDEINQVLGAVGPKAYDPKTYYIGIVSRLKSKGL